MADQKLIIAARNKKGQIGYLSEGLSLPEFADLFKQKGEIQVLVDYSPVIEVLYKLHRTASDEEILIKYNTMFSFWQDAKTYTKESLRISKSEELSKQANSLISELHLKLQKNYRELILKWRSPWHEKWGLVNSIKMDSDIYIDTLLCFIHSKASLDIDSFKGEVVLSGYGEFLQKFITDIYSRLLKEGRQPDSYLIFIAFKQPEKLQDYLNLKDQRETSDQFLLRVLKEQEVYIKHDEYGNCYHEIPIRFDYFNDEFISIVEVFKDLLYKISSVNEFLVKLREGNHQWDDSSESVDELRKRFLSD